jgi:peptidoglycan hydrolase CwlO-like protein
MRQNFLVRLFVMVLLVPCCLFAQASQKPTTEERLIRLEEGQKSLEKRLDDLRGDMNKHFDNLRSDMGNLRSDMDNLRSDINNRFDDLRFWLGLITTVVLAGFAGLLGLLIRSLRQSGSAANGKAMTDSRDAEFEEMRKRVAALETQLKQMQSGPA